jgi:hypothetical protein
MIGGKTMTRTQMVVNDAVFALVQGQDIEALKRRIESAIERGGRFESFVVVGDREVSVLFSHRTSVAFSSETVAFDEWDDGDPGVPLDGLDE